MQKCPLDALPSVSGASGHFVLKIFIFGGIVWTQIPVDAPRKPSWKGSALSTQRWLLFHQGSRLAQPINDVLRLSVEVQGWRDPRPPLSIPSRRAASASPLLLSQPCPAASRAVALLCLFLSSFECSRPFNPFYSSKVHFHGCPLARAVRPVGRARSAGLFSVSDTLMKQHPRPQISTF